MIVECRTKKDDANNGHAFYFYKHKCPQHCVLSVLYLGLRIKLLSVNQFTIVAH